MLFRSLIGTSVLGLSILLGSLLMGNIPSNVLRYISFAILILLGLSKLMDNIIKTIINKRNVINKEIAFTIFNLNFILNIYANPDEADIDKSKFLSPKEAFSLALALSLDSLAAGIGAVMGNLNILSILILSFISTILSTMLGVFIGDRISNKIPFVSWLGGILLILIAFLRIN